MKYWRSAGTDHRIGFSRVARPARTSSLVLAPQLPRADNDGIRRKLGAGDVRPTIWSVRKLQAYSGRTLECEHVVTSSNVRLQCQSCGFTTSEGAAVFSERAICPYCDGHLIRRTDDNAAVLETRLNEFNTKTQPVADHYGTVSVLRKVDGNRDREAVFADISRLIEQSA